ncbi:MAG TPA: ribonuclease HIII [Candidatus Cloacimonadota bacterium]|nr:ribonuclease HIII [Candidatus Cloacimonadota bacterium]
MPKEIEAYLSHIMPLFMQRGISILEQRTIDYGVQLRLSRPPDKAVVNIYHSARRGLSTVVGASQASPLKTELESLLLGEITPAVELDMHNWQSWIGSDECGKGDYFGPLIVTAFYLRREQAPQLKAMGVCDSKALRDESLLKIAPKLYSSFPGQFSSLILKPTKYNELISRFQNQKLNLNDLMAWAHATVIGELIDKIPHVEGVLIDQFSKAQKVKARLAPKYPKLNILERTQAERDLAVAAASILSRYQFVTIRREMDEFYQMELPLGASNTVIKAGKAFASKYGKARLGEVAKLHFKTSLKVLG